MSSPSNVRLSNKHEMVTDDDNKLAGEHPPEKRVKMDKEESVFDHASPPPYHLSTMDALTQRVSIAAREAELRSERAKKPLGSVGELKTDEDAKLAEELKAARVREEASKRIIEELSRANAALKAELDAAKAAEVPTHSGLIGEFTSLMQGLVEPRGKEEGDNGTTENLLRLNFSLREDLKEKQEKRLKDRAKINDIARTMTLPPDHAEQPQATAAKPSLQQLQQTPPVRALHSTEKKQPLAAAHSLQQLQHTQPIPQKTTPMHQTEIKKQYNPSGTSIFPVHLSEKKPPQQPNPGHNSIFRVHQADKKQSPAVMQPPQQPNLGHNSIVLVNKTAMTKQQILATIEQERPMQPYRIPKVAMQQHTPEQMIMAVIEQVLQKEGEQPAAKQPLQQPFQSQFMASLMHQNEQKQQPPPVLQPMQQPLQPYRIPKVAMTTQQHTPQQAQAAMQREFQRRNQLQAAMQPRLPHLPRYVAAQQPDSKKSPTTMPTIVRNSIFPMQQTAMKQQPHSSMQHLQQQQQFRPRYMALATHHSANKHQPPRYMVVPSHHTKMQQRPPVTLPRQQLQQPYPHSSVDVPMHPNERLRRRYDENLTLEMLKYEARQVPKRLKTAEGCESRNIFQLCSPKSDDSISIDRAINQICAKFTKHGDLDRCLNNYINAVILRSEKDGIECKVCVKILGLEQVLDHFLSRDHVTRVRARGAAVSYDALEAWLYTIKNVVTLYKL